MRYLRFIVIVILAWSGQAQGIELQSIFSSGQQAPGAPLGVTIAHPGHISINSHGDISFDALLSNLKWGIWSNSGGELHPIAVEETLAPITPSVNYRALILGGLSDSGETGYSGWLDLESNYRVVLNSSSSGVQKIARSGERPPGFAGESFFTLQLCGPWSAPGITTRPAYNSVGHSAFYATVNDASTYSDRVGIWTNRSGIAEPVVLTDSQAPGFEMGTIVAYIDDSNWLPKINDQSEIAFTASVTVPGSFVYNDAVYTDAGGQLSLITRSGVAAPGVAQSNSFLKLGDPGFNNLGRVAFHATITGPEINQSNNDGIWSNSGGALHLVAREGDPAPGAFIGSVFSSFDKRVLINGADQTLVSARLSGLGIDLTRDSGLWVERNGKLDLVFQEGMQVPGAAPGVVFREIGNPIYGYAMNRHGHLLFWHSLFGPNGNLLGSGLFASTSPNNLELVVMQGQSIEVSPGVSKTVRFFQFDTLSGGEDGSSPLNDDGRFVFTVQYSDGTKGIIRASIPEPVTLAFVGLLAMWRRKSLRPQ